MLSLKFRYKEVHFEFCPRLTPLELKGRWSVMCYAFANDSNPLVKTRTGANL